jgi:hypothetical protein
MWFEDEVISGRRLGSVKRRSLASTVRLRVKANGGGPRRDFHPWLVFLAPLPIAALAYLLWFGARWTSSCLFSGNDRFTIARLSIKDDSPALNDFLRDEKGIKEGSNLFGFDIAQVQAEFLRRAPGYRDLRIARMLPDVLTVEAVPRMPLARVARGWRDALVVDKDGIIFSMAGHTGYLPAITGYRAPTVDPGGRLEGMAGAALQLADVCNNPALGLSLDEIDVGRSDYVVVKARYEQRARRIELSWDGMGRQTPESRMSLLRKLGRWVQTMQTQEGMTCANFDGTYPDRIVGR